MVECMLHMHMSDCDCLEFQDEIPFKEGECKNRKILISGKRAKS